MYCIECGTNIDADRIKCLKCGADQSFFFSNKKDNKFNKLKSIKPLALGIYSSLRYDLFEKNRKLSYFLIFIFIGMVSSLFGEHQSLRNCPYKISDLPSGLLQKDSDFNTTKLACLVVELQTTYPRNLNKNSREGEKSEADWNKNQSLILSQIKDKSISGECFNNGPKEDFTNKSSVRFTCEISKKTDADKSSDMRWYNCMMRNGGPGAVSMGACGWPSPTESYDLIIDNQTQINFSKIYEGDKFKFSGLIQYCDSFGDHSSRKDKADLKCSVNVAKIESIK